MLDNVILSAVLIFFARVLHITLSTLRVLLVTRGKKFVSAGMGFFEALLFALTISVVVQNLGNVWNLVGYSAGFSGGILMGLAIEERLAMGYATVNVVSSQKSHEIAEAIREAGLGATESWGQGWDGEVGLVRTVVRRREVSLVSTIANETDPSSFMTVEQTMAVRRGYLGLTRMRS
jgi:uncharacterized protein YebE (UPF0316 family)